MGWVIGVLVMVIVGQHLHAKWLKRKLKHERMRAEIHRANAVELDKKLQNMQGRFDAFGAGIDYTARTAVDEIAATLAERSGGNVQKLRDLNRAFVRSICSVAIFHNESLDTLTERGFVAACKLLER